MKKTSNAATKYFRNPVTDDPDDAPELLEDFFRCGELRPGDKVVRRGRPPLTAERSVDLE
ncbi:MAG: hypothetical protein QOH32_4071 [Bradyrhizobium sp.]|jgi:hypothetical protein|nr:hypothetical protein [Bradyrhizobium sp.]